MLRSILIYLSQAEWMQRLVTNWGVARRVALRFVAGETLDEAIEVVKQLNQKSKNIHATLDQLGEHTHTSDDARRTAAQIIDILDAIQSSGVRSGLSLKLTQLGLALDEDLCAENLKQILTRAKEVNLFVRIDIEDSACVDPTLRIYNRMCHEYGFENVGMALQSYLFRSEQDARDLLATGTRIRMVKGAYSEPPEIAYPKKQDVDHNFDVLMDLMADASLKPDAPAISEDGRWPPISAAGTHDGARIDHAKEYARQINLPKEKLEFQMLYGIRRELQESLAAEGYPVRVYVPFGTEWYPYFMRRLAERPANLWFFIGSLIRD